MSSRLEELERLLKAVNRTMFTIMRQHANADGLPPQALGMMRCVQMAPGSTVSDVARTADMAKSHVSKTIDLLAARGFVEKRPDPDDQRLVRLYPTAQAMQHFHQAYAAVQARFAAALATLSEERQIALLDGLTAFTDAIGSAQTQQE